MGYGFGTTGKMDRDRVFETTEQQGLYHLAVTRTDAVEVANSALALLERNKRLLSAGELLRVKELREQLAKL
jgi:hypothetical protein